MSYVDLVEKPDLAPRPHQAPRDEKQFVRQVQVRDSVLSKEKKDAKFASEEERYVLEEQRARMNDLTVNRANTSAGRVARQTSSRTKSQASAERKTRLKTGPRGQLDFSPISPLAKAQNELRADNAHGDIMVGGLGHRPQESADEPETLPSFAGTEPGVSSFGEAVPDSVKFGDFTALNTDRHLYYTFYARMEEKIRYRWVTYARAAVYSMANDPRKQTGRDQWVTKLEVILDPQGHFVRAVLHEGSGLSSLDAAPVQAFRDAGQFPNPPPEMVKSDGVIHIYYAFNVNMGPGQVAGN